jgi:hypothetical protein
MAVGFQVTQRAINDRVGQMAVTARLLARQVDQLLVNTTGKSNAELQALPTGGSPEAWSAADVTALVAAVTTLVTIRNAADNGKAALDKMSGID